MLIVDVMQEFRSQVSDQSTPYLFSDDEILRWLVDAQDELVRGFGGIVDGRTPELVDIPITANQPWSSFSPLILRIRSGRLLTAKTPVDFIHEGDLPSYRVRDYGYSSPSMLDDTDTGPVSCGILGITDTQIRWFKVPNTNDTCRLHIYRLPYPRIANENSLLEVADRHHLELISWMKYRAYSKEDAETYDKNLASENKSRFQEYIEQVKQETSRQRHKPKQVRYGGIPW